MYGESKEVTGLKTKTEKDTRTERETGSGTGMHVHIYIQELTISSLHVVSFAQMVLFVYFNIYNGLKVFCSSKYIIRG